MTGKIDGGTGANTLDYSGDGGAAATVNLATSTATRTGGFANIQKLVGSTSAADKLIGPNAHQHLDPDRGQRGHGRHVQLLGRREPHRRHGQRHLQVRRRPAA